MGTAIRENAEKHALLKRSSVRYYYGYECPRHTVMYKTNDYEVRDYENTVWVGCKDTGSNFRSSTDTQFWTLFDYIQGSNSMKTEIPMASPVVTRFGADLSGPAVNFYVPKDYENLVATSIHPKVYARKQKAFRAYVRSFVGFAYDRKRIKKETEKLFSVLENRGLLELINQDKHYLAAYDGPFAYSEGYNEIWMLAKDHEGIEDMA